MTPATGRTPRGGLGRVVFGAVAFALVAPVGLIALPLAILAAVARPRTARSLWVGVPAVVLALWWLALPGDLPDQTVRAAAVMAAAAFGILTVVTSWSTVHRGLTAAAVAAGGLGAGFLVLGLSWDQLHWWVAYRTAATLRMQLGLLWAGAREGLALAPSVPLLLQFEGAYDTIVTTLADLFPATVALQLLAGFVLAVGIHHRTATQPLGRSPALFRHFRFSEHLGWAVVLPLAVFLLVRVEALKLIAANVLVVMATLYVLRGAAVALFGLRLMRPGVLLYALLTVALFFMLPVALGSALVLGILDARLDLRRRWTAPPANP